MLNFDELLEPLTPAAACGPDLEYTDTFMALEQAAAGTAARQDLRSGVELPAEPPYWPGIRDRALELMRRSKDLRVALRYVEASVHVAGPLGLAAGLRLIDEWLLRYWDSVHPCVDAAGRPDPGLRLNVLAGLCDPHGVLKAVRQMPLASAAPHGAYSLRDIEIANGKVVPIITEATSSSAAIEAAFRHCELPLLVTTATALSAALGHLHSLGTTLTEHLGADHGFDCTPLQQALASCAQWVGEWLVRRTGTSSGGERLAERPRQESVRDPITSREDIVAMLDCICDHLARTEPASPVPLLLERAKRLLAKTFVEIIQDLAPEMLPQIEKLRGSDGHGTATV